jgi:hypothetical protein
MYFIVLVTLDLSFINVRDVRDAGLGREKAGEIYQRGDRKKMFGNFFKISKGYKK